MAFKYKLGVIGFGNMSGAILGGTLKGGVLRPESVLVYDIDESKREQAKKLGFGSASDISDLSQCKYILLAVKPQSAPEIYAKLDKSFSKSAVISIMAGVSIDTISSQTAVSAICRCMPNTPALIGRGITAIDDSRLDAEGRQFVAEIFGSVGETVSIPEKQMNAVTALSGSGPAYVYLFIKSLTEAGISLGLDKAAATKLVLATVQGSAELAKSSSDSIDELIEKVCSKGGTTIEGIGALNREGFAEAVLKGVAAANKRAEELSCGK